MKKGIYKKEDILGKMETKKGKRKQKTEGRKKKREI